MALQKAHIIVILKFPYAYGHIVRARKQQMHINCHACDGISVAPKLGNVVICADVPNIHALVTAAHYHVTVASLLGTTACRAQVSHVLGICVELKAEDLSAAVVNLFFFFHAIESALGKLSITSSFRYLGVVYDHFELRVYGAGKHGVGVGALFLRDFPN